MARKVEVKVLDDIDGTPADETVTFGLDGTAYEIDLSAKHGKELRGSLEKFIGAARRMGRTGAQATGRTRRTASPAPPDRAQNRAIRDWARQQKIELSDRGRIPRNIVEQYHAEAGR